MGLTVKIGFKNPLAIMIQENKQNQLKACYTTNEFHENRYIVKKRYSEIALLRKCSFIRKRENVSFCQIELDRDINTSYSLNLPDDDFSRLVEVYI